MSVQLAGCEPMSWRKRRSSTRIAAPLFIDINFGCNSRVEKVGA